MSDSAEECESKVDESADLDSVFEVHTETDEEFIDKFHIIVYRESTKRVLKSRDTLLFCAIILAAVLFLMAFVLTPQVIDGDSMKNTLQNGDVVMLSRISTTFRTPKRYDIVVAYLPEEKHTVIKRVIALPKEVVFVDESGKIHVFPDYANGEYIGDEILISEAYSHTEGYRGKLGTAAEPLRLSGDEFLILGDNRAISKDSRSFGPVSRNNIIGKVIFRVLPFGRFGKIPYRSVQTK